MSPSQTPPSSPSSPALRILTSPCVLATHPSVPASEVLITSPSTQSHPKTLILFSSMSAHASLLEYGDWTSSSSIHQRTDVCFISLSLYPIISIYLYLSLSLSISLYLSLSLCLFVFHSTLSVVGVRDADSYTDMRLIGTDMSSAAYDFQECVSLSLSVYLSIHLSLYYLSYSMTILSLPPSLSLLIQWYCRNQ